VLTDEERQALEAVAASYTSPYCQVMRAKVVLLAEQEWQNKQIAEHLHLPRQIVSKWRKRFFEERLAGLPDRPRRGRPRSFSPSGRR
jgi:transposase